MESSSDAWFMRKENVEGRGKGNADLLSHRFYPVGRRGLCRDKSSARRCRLLPSCVLRLRCPQPRDALAFYKSGRQRHTHLAGVRQTVGGRAPSTRGATGTALLAWCRTSFTRLLDAPVGPASGRCPQGASLLTNPAEGMSGVDG